MSDTPKRKRPKWKCLLQGAGSILVLDPAAGPPVLTRQQMAAARAARMEKYAKGRKSVVTLVHPVSTLDAAATKSVRIAEATVGVIESRGFVPKKLTNFLVFGRNNVERQLESSATKSEDVR